MNHWLFVVAAYAVTVAASAGDCYCQLDGNARGGEATLVKAKNQRLMLAALAMIAVVAAGLLALSALKDQAAFFYAPSDVKKDGLPLGKAVRLGGMVAAGSIKRAADGVTMHFVVTDGQATTPVTFAGIAPDLFREKSGVVAEGQFQSDGSFIATNLLAKHDEKYMPPELAGKMHETKSLKQ